MDSGISRRGILAGSAAVAVTVASGEEARARTATDKRHKSPKFRRVDLQK